MINGREKNMDLPISGVITIRNFLRKDEISKIPYLKRGDTSYVYFKQNRQYDIPAYQRGISWNPENVQILLKDLCDGSKFLGNVLLSWNEGEIFEIIDGQQRISVLIMILNCLSRYDSEDNKFEICSFVNKSFPFFFDALIGGFELTRVVDIKEYMESDCLDQHETYKALWLTIKEFVENIGETARNKLFRNLLDSYISVLVSDVQDGSDESRRVCIDYFIDINNKSVQLEYIDILKAYAFRENYEHISKKWVNIHKKLKKLSLKGITYNQENIFYHYLLCTINQENPIPLKKGLSEDYKIIEDVFKDGKKYSKGVDIELLITKPNYYKNMVNRIESYIEFLLDIADDKISPGDKFCQRLKVDNRDISYDTLYNTFTIISNMIRNSDAVPKMLLMKYYLFVILEQSRSEDDVKSIYWVNALAVLFSASKTASKASASFSSLVLKDNFVDEVKKLAIKRLMTFPSGIGFAKEVLQDKQVTSTSGQYLSRRVNTIFGAYIKDGDIEKYDELRIKELLNTQGIYNDEHFFINESGRYSFDYKGHEVSFETPSHLASKISYLGNYIKIKSSINTELGNKMIKDKIRIISDHINAGEKDIFSTEFGYLVFLIAAEVFGNSKCKTELELQNEDSVENAKKVAEKYYLEEFETDFMNYLTKIADAAYVISALRKMNYKKVYISKECTEDRIEGEIADLEGIYTYHLEVSNWPCFRLNAENGNNWKVIRNKVINNELTEIDLEKTDLCILYEYVKKQFEVDASFDINDYFSNILSISDDAKKCIYCLVDFQSENKKPIFYEHKKDLIKDFILKYAEEKMEWIKMDKKTFDLCNERVVLFEEFEIKPIERNNSSENILCLN